MSAATATRTCGLIATIVMAAGLIFVDFDAASAEVRATPISSGSRAAVWADRPIAREPARPPSWRQAQAIGTICRSGAQWCIPGGWGFVGQPCCCPTFCGGTFSAQ